MDLCFSDNLRGMLSLLFTASHLIYPLRSVALLHHLRLVRRNYFSPLSGRIRTILDLFIVKRLCQIVPLAMPQLSFLTNLGVVAQYTKSQLSRLCIILPE